MSSIHFELAPPEKGREEFRPGDAISGVMHLDLSAQHVQRAGRVEVALSGRSEIYCTAQEVRREPLQRAYQERVPFHGNGRMVFFDDVQVVGKFDSAAQQARPGPSVWPFRIVFPAVSSEMQRVRHWPGTPALPMWPSVPGLPLPPSFHLFQESWHDGSTGQVAIIYELQARLVSTSGEHLAISVWLPPFVPYNTQPVPLQFRTNEQSFKVESRHLTSKSGKTSFRQSLALKQPFSAFRLVYDLPNSCTVGQVLPLYIGVEYDVESSTAAELPPVLLQEVRVSYKEKVQLGFRMASQQGARLPPGTLFSEGRKHSEVFSLKDQQPPLQITERTPLHQLLTPNEKLVLKDYAFETPNIRRYYTDLTVVISFTCAGKKFTGRGFRNGEIRFRPTSKPIDAAELQDSRLLELQAGLPPAELQAPLAAVGELHGKPVQEFEGSRPGRGQGQVYELPAFGSPTAGHCHPPVR